MRTYDFDLFVIGGGSGGVRAARMAAQRGARVAVAEAAELGGTCVNVGCIPKKLYSYAASYGEAFEEAAGYGWRVPPEAPQLDWSLLKSQRAREITRLNGIYGALLQNANVKLLNGWAQLLDAHTVDVDGQPFTARHILIATGGTPFVPELPGREHAVTSDGMFDLDPFPKRLLVVGGGYIACEFASIFNGLGATVTQVHRRAHVLSGFDDDVRQFVSSEMGKAGVDLMLSTEVQSITRGANGLEVMLSHGRHLEVDTVLMATGRVPNTQALGLEAAGVAVDKRGAIAVDGHYNTSVPSIYAVGDVSTSVQLTPVALAEAMVVVDALFGERRRRMDYEFIPTAVFTHPNIGTCGYSETDARAKYGKVTVFSSEFRALRHTLSGSTERTFMKLIVDTASDRVVGLHMVGADAGEIVQGFAVAMRAGATKALFDSTIGIHPTMAEEFVTMRDPVAGSMA
ncbi:glutathione-disulfide reductase [Variovorax sp. PAMC 28711]|uniref:glutathione-disulfide reductase n=1 Tax=Variovorax sp. PAMC 28711 TaxID=1795631 RepID=UPI00078CE499|nr:glutathione-disulfide reductase [Variovorax sp. PAMC 28711]AMM24232.1 glutathione reductase [Variovorax sp. PAMC 28711]